VQQNEQHSSLLYRKTGHSITRECVELKCVLESFVLPTFLVHRRLKNTHTDCPIQHLTKFINWSLILNHYGTTAKNSGNAKKIIKQLPICRPVIKEN
jgi:hypothetical protein